MYIDPKICIYLEFLLLKDHDNIQYMMSLWFSRDLVEESLNVEKEHLYGFNSGNIGQMYIDYNISVYTFLVVQTFQ